MLSRTNPLGVIAFIVLCMPTMYAQQSINASGGEADGIGGLMSYSIGQVAYTSISGAAGDISQGVQQAYLEIMVSSEDPGHKIDIRLFPNPSASYTSIDLGDHLSVSDLSAFSYRLYDLYGNHLWAQSIQTSISKVPTAHLASGMYILKVFHLNHPIKTFRFIKTE